MIVALSLILAFQELYPQSLQVRNTRLNLDSVQGYYLLPAQIRRTPF